MRASPAVKVWAWLAGRKIELAVVGVGILLRATMLWNFHFGWNYDSDLHWEVVEWILEHRRVPRAESTFESFHPPLYYAVAAWLVDFGFTRATLPWFSVACGTVRLGLLWAGLELYLPASRLARVMALALAATIGTSVHVDGMSYAEPMSGMLNAAVLLLVPLAFRRRGAFRLPFAMGIGLLLGVSMLAKISALTTLGAVLCAALVELVAARRPWRERLTDALPWAVTLVVVLGVSGWYYARNVREYGTPFVTSFTLPSQRWLVTDVEKLPLLDRRPLGFLLSWSDTIYKRPYRPSSLAGRPRFFPVAVASSVVDYWQYGFHGFDDAWSRDLKRPGRPLQELDRTARRAVWGGSVVFFAIVAAWVAASVRSLRRRDVSTLALLLAPLFMLIAAVQFAVVAPVDDYGVIKGAYMTFAAPPMYGLFGVSAAWAASKPTRWPLLGVLLGSLFLVAAYTFVCRFGL